MSASNHTAGYMADKIAPFVDLCYPQNSDEMFQLLTLVQNEIWMSGKFHDSTRWYYCATYPDGTIKTPHGYNILLGIDVNGKPQDIRDEIFLFHMNGPGDVMAYNSKTFDRGVYDLGTSPVLFQPTDRNKCSCCKMDTRAKFLYVVSDKCTKKEPFLNTVVSGLDCKGAFIYSYEKSTKSGIKVCQCEQSLETEGVEVIHGVKYPITGNRFTYKNIKYSEITNIIKEPTQTPVEYWSVDEKGNGFLIARLEPNEVLSSYRTYRIPTKCNKNKCVLGLFKRSKPQEIVDANQILITSNYNALLSLCIGVDFKYNKKKVQSAVPYIQDAFALLNADLKEHKSNSQSPLQIEHKPGTGWGRFPDM